MARIFTANVKRIFEQVKVAPKVTCLLCGMPGCCDMPVPNFFFLKKRKTSIGEDVEKQDLSALLMETLPRQLELHSYTYTQKN